MTESILNVNKNSSQCNIEFLEFECGTVDKMDVSKIGISDTNTLSVVRSVAMSENIARSVKEEVKHFIHVESSVNNILPFSVCLDDTQRGQIFPVGKTEYHIHNDSSSISYILPSVHDSIVSGVILSKWDDIMGPQTVHMWLREDVRNGSHHSSTQNNTCLAKAVKYVTSHTVNYTGAHYNISSNTDTSERNSSIFLVPELDLIAQSLVFQLRDQDLNTPYSLAVMVSYQHYSYFLHFRQLYRHWLQRMTARLHVILLKVSKE